MLQLECRRALLVGLHLLAAELSGACVPNARSACAQALARKLLEAGARTLAFAAPGSGVLASRTRRSPRALPLAMSALLYGFNTTPWAARASTYLAKHVCWDILSRQDTGADCWHCQCVSVATALMMLPLHRFGSVLRFEPTPQLASCNLRRVAPGVVTCLLRPSAL